MPTYEAALLLRQMPKDQLVTALKRAAGHIFEEGGIIRKLSNLGDQPLPYKISNHGKVFKEASYFVVEFDCPTSSVDRVLEAYGKDTDILRRSVFEPVKLVKEVECTIEDETKPAPYRTDVQAMLRLAEKQKKKLRSEKFKIKPSTGLDYDPFPS